MKILLFFSSLFTTIFLTNCAKDGQKQDDLSQLSALTKEVISKPSIEEMKQAQTLLSDKEREQLWKTKYSAILKKDAAILTSEQNKIINELSSFLKENNISSLKKSPEIGDAFLEKNLSYFEKHFSKQQLYALIESPIFFDGFTLSKIESAFMRLSLVDTGGGSGDPKCLCRYDISCPGAGNDCDYAIICRLVTGCGIFGTSLCKGRCSIPGLPRQFSSLQKKDE